MTEEWWLTGDPELADRIRVLRVHGGKPKYHHRVVGGNFRLDTIQAAVLNVKLNYLDAWTRRRQANARRYEDTVRKQRVVGTVRYRITGSRIPFCRGWPIITFTTSL